MKKEDCFSKLKIKCLDDNKIGRTKEIIEVTDIKKGEHLTKLCLKKDVFSKTYVFEKIVNVSTKEDGIHPLYCISLPGYTYQSALKYTDLKLQTLKDKDLIL